MINDVRVRIHVTLGFVAPGPGFWEESLLQRNYRLSFLLSHTHAHGHAHTQLSPHGVKQASIYLVAQLSSEPDVGRSL